MSATARKELVKEAQRGWANEALAVVRERQQRVLGPGGLSLAAEGAATWGKASFPSPRSEEWKYTNPEIIAAGSFRLASGDAATLREEELSAYLISSLAPNRLVFVDGSFSEDLSQLQPQEGVEVSRLANGSPAPFGALRAHTQEPFAALAAGLLQDGVSVQVGRGVRMNSPLHVLHVMTQNASGCVVAPRLFVDAQELADVSVIESSLSLGGDSYLSLPVVEVRAAEGARVDLYRLQDDALSAFVVSNTDIEQARDSTVRTHVFSFGGRLVRNNAAVRLRGPNANAVLNGLSVLAASQHVDNSTLIHHVEPSCESREHFKGVYADASRGVFSGTITVEQDAQKTNAFQSNQALLLSPNASIETRPQLKIWADDVKCTHGATVGQLDPEAMFYLRSRGIGKEAARKFLVHAFASEVLVSVLPEVLRQHIEAFVSRKLDEAQGEVAV